MRTAKHVQLIETDLTTRGTGSGPDSPFRVITEFWTPDGTKVAEVDPCATVIQPEQRAAILKEISKELRQPPPAELTPANLEKHHAVTIQRIAGMLGA